MRFWRKRLPLPSVTFATACWERDWKQILCDETYLPLKQIGHHGFAFAEKKLIINNVQDLAAVKQAAQKWLDARVLSHVVVADEIAREAMAFFQLDRSDFQPGPDADQYPGVNPDWIYYNALAPLSALYSCTTDYLLYLTGDVRLDEPLNWIEPALCRMEKEPLYKVANPAWNHRYKEVKKESLKKRRGFYVSDAGFSDQLFLVRSADFRAPIYGEVRADAAHFPRGDVFEKRAFSAMKNRGWLRLTYAKGSYIHENF